VDNEIVSEYKYPVDVSDAGAVTKIESLSLPNAFSSGGMMGVDQWVEIANQGTGSIKGNHATSPGLSK
jgi:hypothetical protein